jgi:hypothetical protein
MAVAASNGPWATSIPVTTPMMSVTDGAPWSGSTAASTKVSGSKAFNKESA